MEDKLEWPNRPYTLDEFKHLPLSEMLSNMPIVAYNGMEIRSSMPRLFLNDGVSLSVQAGEHLYCSPRSNKGPYTQVEIGFPSEPLPELFMPYCEKPDNPTETVYAYVPLELVLFYIGSHGGIDAERSFATFKFH